MMETVLGDIPEHYTNAFFVTKGILGLIGTVALIAYMSKKWDDFKSRGQRLRFLCLLYFAVLVTGASAEQIQEGVEISLRNIGGLGGVALLIYTVYVSACEDIFKRK